MKKKKIDLTRKQLAYISSRPMTTIENWLNRRTEMPEHIFNAKQEVINLMKQQKKAIKEYENERK